MALSNLPKIGIIGAGTMGEGIAQVAATFGHVAALQDTNFQILERARNNIKRIIDRLVEKGSVSKEEGGQIFSRISFEQDSRKLQDSGLVIEAIVEDLSAKKTVFGEVESLVSPNCIIATNTSSLSVTALASCLKDPSRALGIHFFNPAPLMPLVEIVPGLQTAANVVENATKLVRSWKKTTVLAKDTPGFIVNRIARPYYGESIRILEEGIADIATIDWALKEIGGFKMGPFELMDLIGNDINFKVSYSVWESFFYDSRYRPSFTQRRLLEAGHLGKKSGRGYYDYKEPKNNPEAIKDKVLGNKIFFRVLSMLINEAADALFLNIATKEDIDTAMTKGVNYPKGLLSWSDSLGLENILTELTKLHDEYGEERYRPCPLLKRKVREGSKFY